MAAKTNITETRVVIRKRGENRRFPGTVKTVPYKGLGNGVFGRKHGEKRVNKWGRGARLEAAGDRKGRALPCREITHLIEQRQ